jgi:hypothetical protein
MVYDGYGALKTNFSSNDDLTFIVVPPPTTRGPINRKCILLYTLYRKFETYIARNETARSGYLLYGSKNTCKKSGKTKNCETRRNVFISL